MENIKKEYAWFKDIEKQYSKEFKRAGITADKLYSLQEYYTITETKTEYRGTSRKPVSEETEIITAYNLACIVSGIGFFNDRIGKNYTMAGYMPVRLTAVSPDKSRKIVRRYDYTYGKQEA